MVPYHHPLIVTEDAAIRRTPVPLFARPRLHRLEARDVPAVITVTTSQDNTFSNVPGVTLRDAIVAAQTDTSVNGSEAGSGADTIVFAPTVTFPITVQGPQSTLSQAAFLVDSDITIDGFSGTNPITISSSPDLPFRLFDVGLFGRLTLRGLTLSGGRAVGGGSDDGSLQPGGSRGFGGGGGAGVGGAIFNQGQLVVESCTLVNNVAAGGAGGRGHTVPQSGGAGGGGFSRSGFPGQFGPPSGSGAGGLGAVRGPGGVGGAGGA
jgi:hypothetical protein